MLADNYDGKWKNWSTWKHYVFVGGKARNIKCKYCEKVSTRGIYKLKHPLIGTSKDVEACVVIPEEVKKLMLDIVTSLQQNLMKKSISREDSSMGDS